MFQACTGPLKFIIKLGVDQARRNPTLKCNCDFLTDMRDELALKVRFCLRYCSRKKKTYFHVVLKFGGNDIILEWSRWSNTCIYNNNSCEIYFSLNWRNVLSLLFFTYFSDNLFLHVTNCGTETVGDCDVGG